MKDMLNFISENPILTVVILLIVGSTIVDIFRALAKCRNKN